MSPRKVVVAILASKPIAQNHGFVAGAHGMICAVARSEDTDEDGKLNNMVLGILLEVAAHAAYPNSRQYGEFSIELTKYPCRGRRVSVGERMVASARVTQHKYTPKAGTNDRMVIIHAEVRVGNEVVAIGKFKRVLNK